MAEERFGSDGAAFADALRRLAVSFDELFERRLILVTGKGGVGKTTLSAALAVAAARMGRRAVICEVGGPSQIAPLFGAGASDHEPRRVADRVSHSVLSPEKGIRAYLAERIRVPGVVELVFKQPPVAKFFRAAPAFSEMGVLYAVTRLLDARDDGHPWDHVIVDLPASGHALGMLEAPFEGKRIFRGGPVRALCESVEGLLLDRKTTTCAVVTLPEELPATEAVDLASKLESRGFGVGAVVANAVETPALDPEEEGALRSLGDRASPHLLEAAVASSRRAARHGAVVERLGRELGRPPLSLSLYPKNGAQLVGALADEIERQTK